MKNKKRDHFLVVVILIAVIIIVALDILCILFVSFAPALNLWLTGSEVKITGIHLEDALLSTCLSIIAMAISVWAVLNVLNALDKKSVDDLQNDLENIKSRHIQSIEEISNIQLECSKNELLSELIKNLADCATEIIYKTIQNMPASQSIPFYELTRIEQSFFQVYKLHGYAHDTMILKKIANQGIKEINVLRENIKTIQEHENKIIEYILQYRLGGFYYYKAYCYKDQNRMNLALQAIEHYKGSMELFGLEIPEYCEYDGQYPCHFGNCTGGEKEIASYICNIIGDTYSIIIKKGEEKATTVFTSDEIEQYGRMAVFYCAYAVEWSGWSNEVYLRNYGCALERMYSIKMCNEQIVEQIFKIYQTALDISIVKGILSHKAFYTWLSFYHKQTDTIVEQLIRTKSSKRVNKDFRMQILQNQSENATQYAVLAMQSYREKIVFQKFYTFALRNLCVLELVCNKNKEKAAEHFLKMKKSADALNVYYHDPKMYDDFMKKINDGVKILEGEFLASKKLQSIKSCCKSRLKQYII